MENNEWLDKFAQLEGLAEPDADEQDRRRLAVTRDADKTIEKQVELLNHEIRISTDAKKIKPLKELAVIGGLESLRYILPLSKYSSEFLRKLARNAVIKIILRTLREDEEKSSLGIHQKKKLLNFLIQLERKYVHLRDMELSNPKAVKQILDILVQENIKFTASTLAEIIGGSDKKVRASAVKMIAEMTDEKETTLLVKLLNDPDERVRANVIESLETMGNRNVLGILMKYKRDKSSRIRANTLKSLWSLGYKDVEGSLREMLLDQNSKMRTSAVWVIGEIGHKQTDFLSLLEIVENDGNKMVQEHLDRAKKKISWHEKGLRVLVVDSDKDSLGNFFRALARDGFHILAAFDGETGVAMALKQQPDIIVLNLRIPGMNGLDVIKELRAQEATENIPVMVVCDFNSSLLIKTAMENGANDYLIKPFSYEQAREKIQMFLS